MKKFSPVFLSSIVFLIAISFYVISKSSITINGMNEDKEFYEEEYEDELSEINGLMEFEFEKKKNPFTNEIPSGALMHAYQQLKDRGFYLQSGSRADDDYQWKQANDEMPNLAITKITYDPNHLHTFYYCTGEGWFNADAVKGYGVFKSNDGGESWQHLESTDTSLFDYCQDLVVHPITSDIYVATRSGGVQRSTDGGDTFEKVLGQGAGSIRNSICDIEITSDGGVFVAIGIFDVDGVYYSPSGDSGTYTKLTAFPTGNYRIKLATCPSNPDACYAIPSGTDFKIKGIFRTEDRGNTWNEVAPPGGDYELAAKQAWYDLSLAVDPNDEFVIAAGGLNVWKSTDGGSTWDQISSGKLDSSLIRYMHVDQHEIIFQSSDTVYFTNDGGIYKCDNFSSDKPIIYEVNTGYNVTQYYAISPNPIADHPGIIGGTQDNGSTLSLNYGIAKHKFVSGADGAFCAYKPDDGNIFYTTTQYKKIFRFTHGGFEIPDTITNPYITDLNTQFINPLDISPYNPDVLFQAANNGLWRLRNASTADSSAWEKGISTTGTISALAFSSAAEDMIFLGKSSSNGEIFVIYDATTIDGAATPIGLDPLNYLPDAVFFGSFYCSSISVDQADPNHILLSYSNYGVESIWESFNALSASPEWHTVEGDLPDVPVNWVYLHPENNKVAYIATEMGVFFTNNINGDETEWIPSSSLPIVRTDMLKYRVSDNKLFAATHGRGIWEAELDASAIHNDILWIERGPTNVGGRTRTLMIDPNDPSKKTVWAGSVAGGLWKTNNIDLVDVSDISNNVISASVFPNPATDILTIYFENKPLENISISIADLQGNILERNAQNIHLSSDSYSLHVGSYAAGIYFIILNIGKEQIVKKIIIQ